ncbi:hypothetical protein J4E06_11145 [Muricauda sp. NFXS6]|uniref:hypothetical protein n=1 Tax=Allomuricauda sp. NFXS6 TaxID=2819094 RepID=UPI0032DE89E0
MIFRSKIKAGALQFVLFIGTIIVLLLMAFVLMHQGQLLFDKKTDLLVDLVQKADHRLMETFDEPMKIGEGQHKLDDASGINTRVNKEYWGLLEKRTVTSKKGKLQFEKTAFVGYENPNRPALYLRDDNRPMVIVGDAKISGDAYLPERGIKMGNIKGFGYNRSQLIYGRVFRSAGQLPKLSPEVVQKLESLTSQRYMPEGKKTLLKNGMSLKNSFEEETLIVKGTFIELDNQDLIGNIVVWATDKITVGPTARLRDVVLLAPTIEIQQGTKGAFQAIASKKLVVGSQCELTYPTVLAVQKKRVYQGQENQSVEPGIYIGADTSISGAIIYCDKNESKGRPHFLSVDTGAIIHGEVYCEQYLELKGQVFGSVSTNAFVSFENGNTYLNHLFNGQISAEMLPNEYVGLANKNTTANGIVKWLY